MDLFSLLAKLTLDKTEYDDGLKEAEKSAENLTIATPKIPKTDNTDFDAGLKEAETSGNIFKDVMIGVWDGLKSALLTTGVVGMVGGLVSSLREGIQLAAKNGNAISKGAKNLQLSTKAYQEYEYTLGKSNLQIKDLQTAMTKFDTIRSGKITKEQKKYFKELGIDAKEATKGMMSAEELLTGVMDSLADYKGADKGAIIDAFFGKSDKWTGYFDQTKAEIDTLKQEAESLGLIMSEQAVQNAADFNDATEKLGDRLEAIKRSFGEGILPVITDAVNKLMMIIDFFTASDTRTSTEKFTDLDTKYEAKIRDIEATQITAQTLAKTLMNMGDTSTMDATQLAIWKGTAESLISMIPTLSGVIDTENGTISESVDGINDLIKSYSDLEKETAYQTTKQEKQNVIDQKRNKLVEEAKTANEKLAEAEGKRTQAIDAFNDVLKKYGVEGLGYDATVQDIQSAQQKAMGMFYGSEDMQAQVFAELRDAAAPITEALTQAQTAQTEVEKLTADIADGEAAFAEWTSTQGETYGAISSSAQSAQSDVNGVTEALNSIPSDVYSTIHISTEGAGYPQAKGDWSVPFDNYPSLLHRGEMVLTKSQARKYREGQGTADYATIGAMISDSINKAFKKVNVLMNGEKVGDLTTKRVNHNVNANSYSRQRAYGG